MCQSSISLPAFSIKSKSQDIILTSTGELDLHLPRSCGVIGTVTELEQLAEKAKLWIAKQGLCHFMIDFSVNGISVSDADTLHYLEAVIARCDIWKRLELGLVPVTEPRGERTNRVAYSIQHSDLSSALAPPDTASVAVFRSVLYSIDLLTSQGGATGIWKSEGTQRRPHFKKTELCNDENEEYNKLASADRKAVDDFLENMQTNVESYSPSSLPNKRRRLENRRKDDAFSAHVNVLLSTWLECVVLGRRGRRCSNAVALTQSTAAAPLSQLAPGVFNVPYLKNISAKREFISPISTSLARMSNAESPSLRKKVQRLGAMIEGQGASRTREQSDHVRAGIELKIWGILSAETSEPKRRTRSRPTTTS
ncbi:hypothetical protein E4U54_007913 [Claviceps lovelessii]|nr:hypothetical protein E4U54_007913 [Claviceps lovelessii]